MGMRVFNAKIDVDATVKTIADIVTPQGAPLDLASFGARSLLITAVDGDIRYSFDRNDPTDNGTLLEQGESYEIKGQSFVDFRIVGISASEVAIEARYLHQFGFCKTVARNEPPELPATTRGSTSGLPYSLGGLV